LSADTIFPSTSNSWCPFGSRSAGVHGESGIEARDDGTGPDFDSSGTSLTRLKRDFKNENIGMYLILKTYSVIIS
jgi:hypothetical protein